MCKIHKLSKPDSMMQSNPLHSFFKNSFKQLNASIECDTLKKYNNFSLFKYQMKNKKRAFKSLHI